MISAPSTSPDDRVATEPPLLGGGLTSMFVAEQHDLSAVLADYRALGWVPVRIASGRAAAPAGLWFEIVAMPSAFAGELLRELSMALMPAPAIVDCRRERVGVLSALSPQIRLALPRDLRGTEVSVVARGALVPLPTPFSDRHRWLCAPSGVTQLPPWSAVLGASRRILSAGS